MPYTVVQFTPHTQEGDTMHRLTWPMQALGSLPEFRVIDVHTRSPYRYRLAFEADLLVLNMLHDVELVPITRWRKAKGRPTVFEMNDYFFEIDPWFPVFDEWNAPVVQAGFRHMMSSADLVQTSSPFLAKAFKDHCSRVVVFANQLARVPKSLPEKGGPPFVVGWAGPMGHIADIVRVAPAVSKWVAQHDDAVLAIMGSDTVANSFPLPPEKKRRVPWGDMDAYEGFLKGLHIGLAPLRDNPGNRGRSDVKWLEYAANGCVFVGQKMPPYSDSVEHGKTGFLFDDTHELVRALDRLYQDRGLLESVRRAAFDYVAIHRRHDQHIQERVEVYKELLGRTPPEGAEKWNLDELANFPRIDLPQPLPDYLPITLEPGEEAALAELYADRSDVSESSIGVVEQRYGNFHLTHYCRALAAVAQGDLSAAERALRRSLGFYPAAVKSLSLLGQVLLSMRRSREARDMLSLAVQWNPAYVPSYPYLVNAAEGTADLDAAIAATEEWQKHCNTDPRAPMIRGFLQIRADRREEGMDTMRDAIRKCKDRAKSWQLPFAAGMVQVIRLADPLMSKEPRWADLLLEAAEMFPLGLWLAARAGAICFERGDYGSGARILRRARERLFAWECQNLEGGSLQEYRQIVEPYRLACEELARPKNC